MVPLIFCAGGGNLGTEAAWFARSQGAVLVVDTDPQCKAHNIADSVSLDLSSIKLNEFGKIHLLVGRAEEALLDLMSQQVPKLIVPAITGHFAAKFAQVCLGRQGMSMLPSLSLLKKALQFLPNEIIVTIDEQNAVLITSHMPSGLMCQTPCVQRSICPLTGTHKEPMDKIISKAFKNSNHRIIISHILGEAGAISGSDFLDLLTDLRLLKPGDTMALATSCQCHSITNFFEVGLI